MMIQQDVTETDLQAYVDGQLDPAGRLEVADYLVRNPAIAARVLADLRNAEAMRALAGQRDLRPRSWLTTAAQRLERALGRRAFMRRFSLAAAAAIVAVAAGVIGVTERPGASLTSPANAAVPVYVEEAMMSHRTAMVRQHMRSQLEVPKFDPIDVRSVTHIAVPRFPASWRILDVQLFPSDYGPSLSIVIDAGLGQPVSLFAARAEADVPPAPSLRRVAGSDIAYWSREGMIYVLSGAPAAFLDAAARDLSDNQDA